MAATTFRWRNTTGDRQWATVANWDVGALPGSGGVGLDTVIFDGVSQASVIGADRSADNMLHRIITMPDYTGDIGSSGNPLIHYVSSTSATNGRIIHRGSGQMFFEGKAAAVIDVIVDTSLTNVASVTLGGAIRGVYVKSGWVSILPTCSISDKIVVNGTAGYVRVEAIAAAETKPPMLIVTAGRLDNYRATSAAAGNVLITASNGTIVQYGLIDAATQIMQFGGHFIWDPMSVPGAGPAWPDILCNGHLDISQSAYGITFDDIILGQLANISGNVMVEDWYSGIEATIDLRDPYP